MARIAIIDADMTKALQTAWEIRRDCYADWALVRYKGRWYSAHYYDLKSADKEFDEGGEPQYNDGYFEAFCESANVSKALGVQILTKGRYWQSDEPSSPTPDLDTWGRNNGYDLSGGEDDLWE